MKSFCAVMVMLMLAWSGPASSDDAGLIFSDGFELFAQILSPEDGETRLVGNSIPFVGSSTDSLDGPLTGSALVWTSSIDGQIGTGTNFSTTLSLGLHTITLTATNSRGDTATAQITLRIEA